MPGFACIISETDNVSSLDLQHKCLSPTISNKIISSNYSLYRFTLNKFLGDKIFAEDEDVFIITEGIILNFRELQQKHGCNDCFSTIKSLYESHGDEFFNLLRGEFSGLLYDKIKDQWLIFTNHTGSKPVFYFQQDRLFICASELQLVTQILKKMNYKFNMDQIGCYFLLTLGFMLEDFTLFSEIKRLKPGHYIKLQSGQFKVNAYHVLENEEVVNHSQEEIIENLDTLFKNAITHEYNKDREYGYKHLATLSGGLDSRMNVITAHELGYREIFDITFSQSNCLDEIIAKNIATDLGHGYLFYALDNGNYLINVVQDAVMANGGLALYSGAAHALSLYKIFNH